VEPIPAISRSKRAREHAKPGEAMLIFNKTVEIILVFHHLTG